MIKPRKNHKPGPKGKRQTQERRTGITTLIQEHGRWNLPTITELAKIYNTDRKTIYRDLEAVGDSVDIIDADEWKYEGIRAQKEVAITALKKFNNQTLPELDRRAWGNLLLKALDQGRSDLEAWGVKPVSIDTLGVDGKNVLTAHDFARYYEEKKELEK